MAAPEGPNRQSGILSLMNSEKIERIVTDRTYSSTPSMAAPVSALVSPTSISSNGPPPPPYYTGWHPPLKNDVSGLISPPESRRTSDNKTEPPPPLQTTSLHRQSLPSIHEALSSGVAAPPNPYQSPLSANPSSQHQLPYAQPPSHMTPRTYFPDHTSYTAPPRRESPPQHSHQQSQLNPFSRAETTPVSYPEHPRHGSLSKRSAPSPPPNPYAPPRYEPPYQPDTRAPERITNGYSHNPPPHQQQRDVYNFGSPQLPPNASHTYFDQPRYQPQDDRRPTHWKVKEETPSYPFKAGLKRHLNDWDFENNLAQVNIASLKLQDWSCQYNQIASEQDHQRFPDRMPTEEGVNDMIAQAEKIKSALLRMTETIKERERNDEERRRQYGGKNEYADEFAYEGEAERFENDANKKRRGRAAPPGRCHSCNRAETPEWRRGPDGARTLCNACGLHYAKLTRKAASKQLQGSMGSSLRPKSSVDEHPPRQ